jgi:PAS domain S-box-containing protein
MDAYKTLCFQMAEQSPAVLWTTNLESRVTMSWGKGLATLDLSPEQAVGMTLFEFFRVESAEAPVIDIHRRALSGERTSCRLDWAGHVFHAFVEPLPDETGNPIGCLGYAVEIPLFGAASQADERFRDLVESAPDAIVVVDRNGQIVLINAQTERLFGYAREALIGQTVEVLISERFRDRHVVQRESYSKSPQPRPMGSRSGLYCFRKDGTEFASEISLSQIGTGDGALICGAIRDITERKNAERKLETSLRVESVMSEILRVSLEPIPLEAQFQRILDTLFSIPWIALESKGCIYVLDRNSQVLSMKGQRGLPEELATGCKEVAIGQCLCGRAAATTEILFAPALDSRHETDYSGMPPHGHYCVPIVSDGRMCGVMNLYVDEGHIGNPEEEIFLFSVAWVLAGMIKRKESEEALRKSEERFDLAVRGTDAGIWDWDLAGNQVYYSPRWKSMLGCSEEEIGGDYLEWEKRVHPEDLARSLAAIQNYLEGRSKDYEISHRLRHKDGSYRWILARGIAVRDANGIPYRMVGSHIDVTELRRAEEAVKENEFQLLAARRIQEHLLPASPPDVPGFDIAGASYPAESAGGDSFDYLPMEDGSICISIGDVSGHGFASALLMASTLAHLRSLALIHGDPSRILALTNSALYAETEANRFVTLLFGCLDPRTRSFSYSSAGHPTCYVLDASGEIRVPLESTGIPLGMMPRAEFPVVGPVLLDPGDTVLLLTDGVLEAESPNGEDFGIQRALETVRSNCHRTAREIVESLCRAAFEFSQTEHPSDDVTVVVIKSQPHLPPHPHSAPEDRIPRPPTRPAN